MVQLHQQKKNSIHYDKWPLNFKNMLLNRIERKIAVNNGGKFFATRLSRHTYPSNQYCNQQDIDSFSKSLTLQKETAHIFA